MRKVLVLIILILFCFFCLTRNGTNEDAISVFETTDYNYYIYDLDVSLDNITTKNITKTFKNYTIISIEPYNNPIYERYIDIKTYNFDTNKSLETNINEFEEIYLKKINDNNYIDEYQKLKYNGIKINKLTIYVTNRELDLILNNKKLKLIK